MMKWKISARFMATIIVTVILVTAINIAAFVAIIMNRSESGFLSEGSGHDVYSMEEFVRNFGENLEMKDGRFSLDKEGMEYLESKDTWIQVLDDDGNSLFSYNGEKLPDAYTPFDLVHAYKYAGVIGPSEVFFAEVEIEGKRYSYLMGFPMNRIRKYVFIYENREIARFAGKLVRLVIFADAIIAFVLAYLFSLRLTKPLGEIIGFVERLEDGDYKVYKNPKGVYSSVYHKVNNLAFTLRENEIQRNKLNRMRDEWVANISHDIKTPLASIKGYGELLSDDYEFSRDEMRSYGGIINRKSEYIRSLVDDLNLSARLKDKDVDIEKKDINMVSLVREAVIDILNDPKYADRKIGFESESESIMISGDRTLLKRLVNNIIYNSLIHNDENVNIEVSVAKKERVEIVIKDDGRGISGPDLENIFERYYRGTDTGERHKGSGLGMAISRDIARAHGGDIEIESELGKGTRMVIRI